MRLQKFLARAGVDSRRHCEQIILAGRVCVNGTTVTELGTKVDPNCDVVTVDGETVSLGDTPVTIVLSKPSGYLTTMDDPQGRACIAQLDLFSKYPGLFPVGRLDKDTTGLLLVTNDGALGYKLAHPKYHVDKTYVAHVQGDVSEDELQNLRNGVLIYDVSSNRKVMTSPAQARILRRIKTGSVLEITIHEGMNHQVKRMCKAVGHPVIKLRRIAMGPLQLGDLATGSWRVLDEAEIDALRKAADGAC